MNEGRLLGGKYRLVRFVGRGAMGEVWEGRDDSLGRAVAVKLLPLARFAQTVSAEELTMRIELFQREARAMAQITSPHVAIVYDRGREDDVLYLVMEYIDGTSLAERLHQGHPAALTLEQAVRWTGHMCMALGAAHAQGVIHRDIKPGNIMITASGDSSGDAKVVDFGLARFLGSTESHSAHATPLYAAPERFRQQSGDHRTDLYSLGCVLYEMLTGRPPFGNAFSDHAYVMGLHLNAEPVAPGAYRTGIPEELDWLVSRLLAKDPADRPGNAFEVRQDIERIVLRPSGVSPRVPVPRLTDGPAERPHVNTDFVTKIRKNERFIRERTAAEGPLAEPVLDARALQAELTGRSGDARGAAALYRSLGDFCAVHLGRQHPRTRDAYVEVARWTDRADDAED